MFERLTCGTEYTFILGAMPEVNLTLGDVFIRVDGAKAYTFTIHEIHASKDGRTVALICVFGGAFPVL
jgi:hypothetical protein